VKSGADFKPFNFFVNTEIQIISNNFISDCPEENLTVELGKIFQEILPKAKGQTVAGPNKSQFLNLGFFGEIN
jgi:hypothetical protein